MTNARQEGRAPVANNGELDGHRTSTPEASAATHRARTLPRDVVIAEWPKNCRGEKIELRFRPSGRANVLDLRTLLERDGNTERARGFVTTIDHLPKLVQAFARAELLARRLGLLGGEGE